LAAFGTLPDRHPKKFELSIVCGIQRSGRCFGNRLIVEEMTAMNQRLLLITFCLSSPFAMAQSCDVHMRTEAPTMPMIASHICYTFDGMPGDAVNWSCSNEAKDATPSTKAKVAQCAGGYQATCVAKLTAETLANPKAMSKDNDSESLRIPANAQVVTRYYSPENARQARTDCEMGGGAWEANSN
jgi:hypothetical protein